MSGLRVQTSSTVQYAKTYDAILTGIDSRLSLANTIVNSFDLTRNETFINEISQVENIGIEDTSRLIENGLDNLQQIGAIKIYSDGIIQEMNQQQRIDRMLINLSEFFSRDYFNTKMYGYTIANDFFYNNLTELSGTLHRFNPALNISIFLMDNKGNLNLSATNMPHEEKIFERYKRGGARPEGVLAYQLDNNIHSIREYDLLNPSLELLNDTDFLNYYKYSTKGPGRFYMWVLENNGYGPQGIAIAHRQHQLDNNAYYPSYLLTGNSRQIFEQKSDLYNWGTKIALIHHYAKQFESKLIPFDQNHYFDPKNTWIATTHDTKKQFRKKYHLQTVEPTKAGPTGLTIGNDIAKLMEETIGKSFPEGIKQYMEGDNLVLFRENGELMAFSAAKRLYLDEIKYPIINIQGTFVSKRYQKGIVDALDYLLNYLQVNQYRNKPFILMAKTAVPNIVSTIQRVCGYNNTFPRIDIKGMQASDDNQIPYLTEEIALYIAEKYAEQNNFKSRGFIGLDTFKGNYCLDMDCSSKEIQAFMKRNIRVEKPNYPIDSLIVVGIHNGILPAFEEINTEKLIELGRKK